MGGYAQLPRIPAAPWSPKASVSLENLRRNLVITSSVSLGTAPACRRATAAYGVAMRSFFAVALAASSSVCQGFAMKPIKTPGLAMPAVQLIADRCWDTFLLAADVQPLQLGKDIETRFEH